MGHVYVVSTEGSTSKWVEKLTWTNIDKESEDENALRARIEAETRAELQASCCYGGLDLIRVVDCSRGCGFHCGLILYLLPKYS